MSDAHNGNELPRSELRQKLGVQVVWIIPIVAALIAGFLAWHAIQSRGPTITLRFSTADGIQAGQTKVRHKSVDLGTVKTVELAKDMTEVQLTVEMQRTAASYLTSNARFWVVRPRIGLGGISGLETLLSGAYIELDPGSASGREQRDFTGLEQPPAVRSGEPGRTFTLTTSRIGGISSGSPVFYRDLNVGEVLGYELDPKGQTFTIKLFVRKPYDDFVHDSTQFWNASGISLDMTASGVRLQVESLQAVIGGGIAFNTFWDNNNTTPASEGRSFILQPNHDTATTASQSRRRPMRVHFDASVRGLAVGAPVEMLGIQIGTVTGIRLGYNPNANPQFYVEATLDIEMGRVTSMRAIPDAEVPGIIQGLVAQGMRVQLQSSNLLTGQMLVAIIFDPNAPPAKIEMENGQILLPSEPGGLDNITANLNQITKTLAGLPLKEIADNLNGTLKGTNSIANSTELRKSLQSLAGIMTSTQDMINTVNNGLTPALKQLPQIAQGLQTTIDRTNKLLDSATDGYGANSQFKRDLDRLMVQIGDTARSLRILADYLDQHPSALIRGRE